MKYGDRLTVLERETDLLRNQVRAMFFRMNEIGEKNEDHRGVGSAD